MKTKQQKIKRRAFLKGSLATGAAVTVTAAVGDVSTENPGAGNDDTCGQKKGYQETRHVREYYRNSRF